MRKNYRHEGLMLFLCLMQLHLLLPTASSTEEKLTNVALNKPASMSTYHRSLGNPEKAVDGNFNTFMYHCAFTSKDDSNPTRWWRVDLQGLFEVHTVAITNRGDCCGERLADFDVIVDKSLEFSSEGWQLSSELCVHYSQAVPQGGTVSMGCSQPITGRYVTVLLPTSAHPLTLCEVQVLGTPVGNTVQRTSTYHNQPGHKAPGDVIRETYARNVIDCTSTCSAQDGCTAVNLQTASNAAVSGGRRLCQLLDYGDGNSAVPNSSWNLYQLRSSTETQA